MMQYSLINLGIKNSIMKLKYVTEKYVSVYHRNLKRTFLSTLMNTIHAFTFEIFGGKLQILNSVSLLKHRISSLSFISGNCFH